jgi:endonuclease/exonuclease/phosphatase family metal-dependent hydrolase
MQAHVLTRLAALALLCSATACGGNDAGGTTTPPSPPSPPPSFPSGQGSAALLDLATWNIEWFGDAGNGPTNETLQRQNVAATIAGLDQDLWALQEVVDAAQFTTLVGALSGYAGLLANDAQVQGGAQWYSDFGNREQKVALVWRTATMSLLGAKVILTANDNAFAGRPPLEARFRVTLPSGTEDVVVIVLHAKAGTSADDHARRTTASQALEGYLHATWPTQKVFVLGDFNDDLDTSIRLGEPTPYANFLADPAAFGAPTLALSQASVRSTVGFNDMIDHHLVTNEAMAAYQAGSARAFRVDEILTSYSSTTTDHYPVLARYAFGTP